VNSKNSNGFVEFYIECICFLVLNEINQHAHRLDEKPAYFKIADICQPVCRKCFRFNYYKFFVFSLTAIISV
jgi:hypothetical protein